MKQIVVSALSILLVGALFSLTGCDGGGIRPGFPDNTTTPDIPLSTLEADMAKGKTPPPSISGKKLRLGTEPGAPVEAEKEKEKDGTKK